MQAHQLKPPPGARHARKRVGRGNAAGALTKKLTVHAHHFSVTARGKIEAAGGPVVELGERKKKKPRDRAAATSDKGEGSAEIAEQAETAEPPDAGDAPEGKGDGSG